MECQEVRYLINVCHSYLLDVYLIPGMALYILTNNTC